MYRRILAATDGSEQAEKAVEHAATLAKATGAGLLIANVTQPWSALDVANAVEAGARNPVADYEATAARSAESVLDAATAIADANGVKSESLHVRDRAAAEGIVAAADDKDCDLIVIGTHGRRALGRLLLGSHAVEVLTISQVPVLVVR
jgi:nucleotide-binding universal stress UspA family protein